MRAKVRFRMEIFGLRRWKIDAIVNSFIDVIGFLLYSYIFSPPRRENADLAFGDETAAQPAISH